MLMLVVAAMLLHVYVFWRAASVPLVRRRLSRRTVASVGAVLGLCLFFSLQFGHGASGTTARLLEAYGMTWLAALFLAGVTLLAADLLTVFGLLLPRAAPFLRGWALAAAGVLMAVALVQGLRPPVVRDYDVPLAGLPPGRDGTVLVALSDLHVGSVLGRKWLAARVAQVQALRPDIVVVLGDLLEGHGASEGALISDLRRLSAPLGVWAVTGNHEFHGRLGARATLLEEAGFHVLHDQWAVAGSGLILAGVDDLTSRRRAGQTGDPVGHALAGRPPGAAILLSHTPWQADRAAAMGAGLMLSGHTHGGQIWPFGLLESGVYPLLGGRYEVGGMPVIVSRGTGTWGPRMRLWHPSEIVRVTLRSAPRGEPAWEVYAVRYATLTGFSTADLVAGADSTRRTDIAMTVWLLKGLRGHNVVVDTGFHRAETLRRWAVAGFLTPSDALAKAGVRTEDVSDVILTHMHWDHAGGVDLFPKARVWIQRSEWEATADGSTRPGGVVAEDVAALRALQRGGRLAVVDGDGLEAIPGIMLYVRGGATRPGRSTLASRREPARWSSPRMPSTCTRTWRKACRSRRPSTRRRTWRSSGG